MQRYVNKLANLIYSVSESNLILDDENSDIAFNIDDENQFKVLNNIWTQNIDVSDISPNIERLDIGNPDNIINLIGDIGINSVNSNIGFDINNTDGIKNTSWIYKSKTYYIRKRNYSL